MKIYDPAHFIAYVTLRHTLAPSAAAATDSVLEHRLPSSYANQSPRTRLRSEAADRPVDAWGAGRTRLNATTPVVLQDALRALRAAPGGEDLPRSVTSAPNRNEMAPPLRQHEGTAQV